MPSIEQRLKQVSLKVERAKKHVEDLKLEIDVFIATNPYEVACKVDPQTRKPTYYVSSVRPTPEVLPLIAGDAIQNLSSALDHLAYQLVCSDTLDRPPNPNWIYFPIRDTASEYEAKKRGKIQGASQDTIDAIDALKPYKGGNDLLWALYRLNNIEKHRLLLTVGSQAGGVHLGRMAARLFEKLGPRHKAAAEAFEKMTQYITPADKGFPLKPGFELFIDAEGEECDPKQKFLFDVALSEPGIIESKSILETLHQLTALVDGIVVALTPRLRDTP